MNLTWTINEDLLYACAVYTYIMYEFNACHNIIIEIARLSRRFAQIKMFYIQNRRTKVEDRWLILKHFTPGHLIVEIRG